MREIFKIKALISGLAQKFRNGFSAKNALSAKYFWPIMPFSDRNDFLARNSFSAKYGNLARNSNESKLK